MKNLLPVAKVICDNLCRIANIAETISTQLAAQTHRANIQAVKDSNVMDAEKAQEKEAKGLEKKKMNAAAVVLEDEEDEEDSFDDEESENDRGLM
ncbi:hypothetical protein HDU98_000745 [Podochytrium sp. JEL0797]|nr:hypothetical protein HDU98_000745 [Podochytrium sp. JEL0797]